MPGPAQYEEGQSVSTDWRAFRAKLVARERAPLLEELSGGKPTAGNKWAHNIYKPERGCLLIATEKLDGVLIFERTVIMEMRPSASGPFSEKPMFFWGPVEEAMFLVSPQGEGVLKKVVEGVYYGTKESVGCAAEMVKRNMVEAEELSPTVIQQADVGLWEEISGLMGDECSSLVYADQVPIRSIHSFQILKDKCNSRGCLVVKGTTMGMGVVQEN
ncbi:hypothetical protein SASPL_125696 [Salvia splendens]|uniref:Uncharacterized protein n=1 Tax=Salvia splendens TaxID=180675 RepID=A0A8X8XJ06_SALSN|nr:hypothetical protein SASPL_125696 [Salvia splendens]